MPVMCPICRHSQRFKIDQDLRAGRPLRHVADEVGLPIRALRHHHRQHVVEPEVGHPACQAQAVG